MTPRMWYVYVPPNNKPPFINKGVTYINAVVFRIKTRVKVFQRSFNLV